MQIPSQHPDPQAPHGFAELWLESSDALGGFICVHVHDQSLAEDILQEVARQATANFDKYDHERPFIAWLIGIARQRIAEAYREQGRTPITFSSDIVESLTDAYAEIQDGVEERLEGLRSCMNKLNNRHRRVIELRYARKLTQQQIAEQVGTSPRAVNTMLCRIRTALRECVSKYMEGV